MSDALACQKFRLPSNINVVGSLVTREGLTHFATLPVEGACEIVEFRLDAYPSDLELVRAAVSRCPVASLITVRDVREGGVNPLGWTPKRALLLAALEDVDFLDLEIANLATLQDIVDQAQEEDVTVIGSFHDFQAMPPVEKLREIMNSAKELGAEIVKIAVTPASVHELAALTTLLEDPPLPLSVMGMGKFGAVSRLLCGQLGSLLNYGYLDEASVPGQWPAAQLKQLLAQLVPHTHEALSTRA